MNRARSERVAACKPREEASEWTYFVSTSTLDSQSPDLWEIHFCCLGPNSWYCYAAQGTETGPLWCPVLQLLLFLSPRLLISGNRALFSTGGPSPRALFLSWLRLHKISKLSSILYGRAYRLTLATQPSASDWMLSGTLVRNFSLSTYEEKSATVLILGSRTAPRWQHWWLLVTWEVVSVLGNYTLNFSLNEN